MTWQTLGSELPKRRNPVTRFIGRLAFSLMGWRIEGEFPNKPKVVVALVPHSSNVDYLLTILVLWGLGLRSAYLMKHTLFWFPLDRILTALGGIPVDRRSPQGLVGQMVDQFAQRKQLILGITPEGTRSKAGEFKQGFARIAESARVPVLPAVLDYKTKTVRFAALIEDVSSVQSIVERVQAESARGAARV